MRTNFGLEKSKLITQYRFALEQALAKAEFLLTPELVVLQAFILFLVLVRRHDDTRFSWTLTGLAIRMGQSMGLHRDGTSFPGLTPFEIEMRRRLFWALCILDLRSAEDQGTDLTIIDRTFDTELPLNLNDADIWEDMTEAPQARQGATDMTFSLIRYEICAFARRLYVASSASADSCPRDEALSLEERESMVRDIYQNVEQKYFKDITGNPLVWTAANIARVIVAKMTLVIYQPMLFGGPNGKGQLSDDIRERIFTAATEIFEYNHQLNSDPRSKQWGWLFQTYTQWHAVAYVLMEVVRRPWSASVERAWAALNCIFANPQPHDLDRIVGDQKRWLPLRKIYLKAKKTREAEIARLKADPSAAQQLEMQERSKAAVPLSFAAMPGSIKSTIATERWRKLVNAPPLPPEFRAQVQPSFVQPQAAQQQDGLPNMNGQLPGSSNAPSNATDGPGLDQQGMSIITDAMSQPFMADTVWPLAFNPEYQDLARVGGAFPFMPGSGEVPRQDAATIANFANDGGPTRQRQQQPVGMSSGAGQQQPTPLLDALKLEGNVPPWMWQDASAGGAGANIFGNATASGSTPPTTSGTNSAPLSATTPTTRTSFGGWPGMVAAPEDVDMDMNEDFNWADWGQSLMESGGNMGGVWSAHGI